MINKNLIQYDKKYRFFFLEEKSDISSHPVANYYMKPSDLSINVIISLKWADWAYNFFKLISENLLELEDDYRLENLISNSIHSNSELLLNEHEHELYMDDELINDYDSFKNIINGDYSIELFEANSKIHFKLKVNLREYFILENFAFPTLAVLDK